MKVKSYGDVVEQLYEAAMSPGLLPVALQDLSRWLQCDSYHLIGWDEAKHAPTINVVSPNLDGAELDYSRYFHLIDPRRPYVEKAEEGRIYTCQNVFDKSYVSGSEFYQDFLRKYDARYGMGTCLHKESAVYVNLALNRTASQGEFGAEQVSAASRVSPHLRRALKAAIRLEGVMSAVACGNLALDALDQAIVVVDANLQIKAANRLAQEAFKAEELAKDRAGFLRRGRSCSIDLQEMVLDVARGGCPLSEVAYYKRGEMFAKCLVTVAKARGTLLGQYFLLSMKFIESPRALPAWYLASLYGLTPAEAMLAAFVSGGGSIPQYVEDQGVSMPTARTHMRRVMEKAGVQGLQPLIALLAALPRPIS